MVSFKLTSLALASSSLSSISCRKSSPSSTSENVSDGRLMSSRIVFGACAAFAVCSAIARTFTVWLNCARHATHGRSTVMVIEGKGTHENVQECWGMEGRR